MYARVIGLGQVAAGDDGVGFAVVDQLRSRGVPQGVELVHASDDSALIALLDTRALVVLVDAAVAAPPGEVVELTPGDLAAQSLGPVSTHGMGVAQVIELATMLARDQMAPAVRIVAVTITRPTCYEQRLSPAVAAAVPRAVARVLALVGG